MNWLERKRIKQIIHYGWKDSYKISKECGKKRLSIYIDILKCFKNYYIFSNQYNRNKIWLLNKDCKKIVCKELEVINKKHDSWVIEDFHNRRFIKKWSSRKWATSPKKIKKKVKAYSKEFNAKEGLQVQHNVEIHREHFLDGTITIGKNVLLAKNVFIDYSGDVFIGDSVKILDGVLIETHSHEVFSNPLKSGLAKKEKLIINNGAVIGSRAVILESCHEIGRHARIGGGAVVRTNVPPYAVVAGNPAKIVAFVLTPQAMKEFEENIYPENLRTSVEEYEKMYKNYFSSKLQSIKAYTKKSI